MEHTTRTESPASERWEPLFAAEELGPGALRVVRSGAHQLVVGRTPDGAPFALDNRCPHEGYPLAQGDLKGCLLTCCWHNWKFDVRDGSCVLGGEPVRRYAARERDGQVEVDLAPPDPSAQHAAWLASLREGLGRGEVDRAVRDGVRLLHAGFAPERLLAEVARYDGQHAEYGTTHALPVCAELLRALPPRPGVAAMTAVAQALDVCAEADQRLPRRAQPAPLRCDGPDELLAAVEAEDAARAEALLLGALAAGRPRAELETWLLRAVALHFTDFGHQLIYLVKAHELLEAAGDEFAADVLAPLAHSIALGTREDTLPYMRGYFARLAPLEAEPAPPPADAAASRALAEALRAAALDGSFDAACDALAAALRGGADMAELARALSLAGAERLLRFDLALDTDPEVAETWLWATHRFTFAAAVRVALARWTPPDARRLLVQALAFVHSGRPMDAPPERRALPEPVDSTAAEVADAIAAQRTEEALARAAGFLRSARPVEELRLAVEELCLADPRVRPIVVAHAIKTAAVAFEERAALEGHPDRDLPLLAAVRFLASPVAERRLRATVARSIAWVVDGRVPRKLTQ